MLLRWGTGTLEESRLLPARPGMERLRSLSWERGTLTTMRRHPALRAVLCPARRRPPRRNGERFVPPSSAGTRIHHPAAPDSRPSQSPRPSRPAPRLAQPIPAAIPLPGIPRAAAEGAVTPEGRGRVCACAICLATGRKWSH